MCVCCYVASMACAGLSPLARRRREGSPADAPAVRSAVTAVPTRPRIISRTALRRAIGPRTPAAHVKVLVSHDASEAAAGASLLAGAASRRAALNLWLLASAGDHWLVRSEPFRGNSGLARHKNESPSWRDTRKFGSIQTIPCTRCPRGRRLSKARDDRSSTGPPGSSQCGLSIALFTRCPARRRLGV